MSNSLVPDLPIRGVVDPRTENDESMTDTDEISININDTQSVNSVKKHVKPATSRRCLLTPRMTVARSPLPVADIC